MLVINIYSKLSLGKKLTAGADKCIACLAQTTLYFSVSSVNQSATVIILHRVFPWQTESIWSFSVCHQSSPYNLLLLSSSIFSCTIFSSLYILSVTVLSVVFYGFLP